MDQDDFTNRLALAVSRTFPQHITFEFVSLLCLFDFREVEQSLAVMSDISMSC